MHKFEAKNPDFEATLKKIILAMPIAKFYGMRFVSMAPGDVQIEMPYRDELSFMHGVLQAGPIGTLLDFAAGCSVGTLLPPHWANSTVDVSFKAITPARGERFLAHGVAVSVGKTLSVGEAKVYAIHGDVSILCAAGMVTMRNFPVT